jgi:hypothetical protein
MLITKKIIFNPSKESIPMKSHMSLLVGGIIFLLATACDNKNSAGFSGVGDGGNFLVDVTVDGTSDTGTNDPLTNGASAEGAGGATSNTPDRDDALDPAKPSQPKDGTAEVPTGEDAEDIGKCIKKFGANVVNVKISGNKTATNLTKESAMAIKMSGNLNTFNLNLSSAAADAKVKGICLFITGNQSKAVLKLGLLVEEIYIIARGNQANVDIEVLKAGELGLLSTDMKGNDPAIHLHGEGKFTCEEPQSEAKGKQKGALTCEKPAPAAEQPAAP